MSSETTLDLQTAAIQAVQAMRLQVGQVIIGQQTVIDQVLMTLLAGGHALIEGVPGLGKTLLVKSLAKTISGAISRIQFTPDLMPADVMGHSLYDLQRGEFSVRKGPVFTNLLLADEINRAPAKTQSALLEAMQEAQVTIDGQSHPLAAPFMVLATQNPIEQEGTYPLPEAQLDRFLLKISIEYPSQAEEISMVRSITQNKIGDGLDVAQVQAVLSPAGLLTLQQLVASLRVDEQVLDYAVRIVRATRQFSGISNGAGPRAAIAIIRVARAAALLAGRDFVTPDDIKTVAIPALRHRVRLSPEMEIEGQTADSVLARLLTQITAPRG